MTVSNVNRAKCSPTQAQLLCLLETCASEFFGDSVAMHARSIASFCVCIWFANGLVIGTLFLRKLKGVDRMRFELEKAGLSAPHRT